MGQSLDLAREGAGTGADLQNGVVFPGAEEAGDALAYGRLVEEVLAEALLGPGGFAQGFPGTPEPVAGLGEALARAPVHAGIRQARGCRSGRRW